MGLAEAFDQYDAAKKAQVMEDTWGHMRDTPDIRHHGTVIFAESEYRERVVLCSDFGDAGFGPWFWEHAHEWLSEQDMKPGRIYTFRGWYLISSDGLDEYEFSGKITSAPLPAA
jgi:hypothetical protein